MTVETLAYGDPSRTGVRREARRRFVVKAVIFIFILSLVEGPLRKWLLPEYAGILTLLRDPFVLALYVYCFVHGFVLTRGIGALWLWFAFLTSVLGLLQYQSAGLPIWGWMLGVRTYWLYMPLAFVVASTFKRRDIHSFIRLNLWIAMPYALLVAAQYDAPPNALINLGVGADAGQAVGVGGDILRPFGLFTYTGPNVQFTAAMIAIFVAFYVGDVPIRRRALFLLASSAAVGAMSVLTGSRSIYFLAGIIVGLTLLGLFLARPSWRTLRRGLGILGFTGLSAAMFVIVFPDMLEAMAGRFTRAAMSEGSIWNRVFAVLLAWVEPLLTAPLFGSGIGAGAPGVARMLDLPALIYGEGDTQRNLNELGLIMGTLMLALRFGTAAWLVFMALRLARHGHLLALPLAGFCTYQVAFGQITHSPLNAYLVWLILGIVVSMNTEVRRKCATSIPHAL